MEKIVLLLGHWIWGLGHSFLDRVPSLTTVACFQQELVRIVLKGFGWGEGEEEDGYQVVLSSAGGPERHWADQPGAETEQHLSFGPTKSSR